MMNKEDEQKNDQKLSDQDRITFDDFDKLNLKLFGENLFQIMEKGMDSSVEEQGAYTISLNAEFGNGKTTFLKMFKHFIEDEKNEHYNVLLINAWESDFYKEPVITILLEFVNWMKSNGTEEECIKNIISTMGRISMNIGNQLVQSKIGIDLTEIKDAFEGGNSLLDDFDQRKKAIQNIRTYFEEYTQSKKLIIIVDELDRTRPDYAVRFLEDMKHFFDIKNVVFLVAVNRKQMEATVKCLYGQGLDFNGYYRKFFKQEMDLLDPYMEAQRFIEGLIQKTNVNFQGDNKSDRIHCSYLSCKMFKLTLREIESFIRIFDMILSSKRQIPKWIYMDCYSFFICLFLKKKDVFREILKGSFTVDKFIQLKKSIESNSQLNIDDTSEMYYLLKYVSFSFMKDKESKTDKNLIIKTFSLRPDDNVFDDIFSSLNDNFDRRYRYSEVQPALDICKKIDQCKSVFND